MNYKKLDCKKLLSEAQEQTLVRYFDGESSWFERGAAKRLLARSAEAQEFLSTLQVVAELTRGDIKPQIDCTVNLWQSIEDRIEQEERASLYLGKRIVNEKTTTKRSFRDRLMSWDHFAWAASGAALASALFLVVGVERQSGVNAPTVVAAAAPIQYVVGKNGAVTSQLKVVSLEQDPWGENLWGQSFSSEESSKSLVQRSARRQLQQNPLEVDWMKSDGRVKLVQNSPDRSAIIWVQKRRPLDAQRLAGNQNPPLIVYNNNNHMPQALTVAGGTVR